MAFATPAGDDTFWLGASKYQIPINTPQGNLVWASLVKTIMRTIYLMTGKSKSQVVASTEDDAFRIIQSVASPLTPTSAELGQHLRALYAAMGAPDSTQLDRSA